MLTLQSPAVTLCTKSLDIQENLCCAHTVNGIYVNGMISKETGTASLYSTDGFL
jgi:hypothetical protein